MRLPLLPSFLKKRAPATIESEIETGAASALQDRATRQARHLRTARLFAGRLEDNEAWNFSRTHALAIWPLDAVYSFIPKNACSTLRYSIALSNGFLRDKNDVDWIHGNNDAFEASRRDIVCADYTFVILRCPWRRLASCFLSMIVSDLLAISTNDVDDGGLPEDFDPEAYLEMHDDVRLAGADPVAHFLEFGRAEGRFYRLEENSPDISFARFVEIVSSQTRPQRNEHWRNQCDFLIYEDYDDYFSVEQFGAAVEALGRRGLAVHDTRELLHHDLGHFEPVEGCFANVPVSELRQMKAEGRLPSYRAMFDDACREIVRAAYADDIALYARHCDPRDLLFEA